MKLKLELIQDDGTVIDSKIIDNISNGKINITLEPKIDVKMIVHDFSVTPVFDKDHQQFIDYLCAKYDHVCRGGRYCTHWVSDSTTENDVIVYEAGVKGPADWFYKKNDVWHHGGYTSHKETYTNAEFEDMIIKIGEHNKKWEKRN